MASPISMQAADNKSINCCYSFASKIIAIAKAIFDLILWLPRKIVQYIAYLVNRPLKPLSIDLQEFTGIYGSNCEIDHKKARKVLKKLFREKNLNTDAYATKGPRTIQEIYGVKFDILDQKPFIVGSGDINNPRTRVRYTGDQNVFIDANYIQTVYENRSQTDLACRCPRIDRPGEHGSLDVFMRMIWENKVDTVVNLVHPDPIIAHNNYLLDLEQGQGLQLLNNSSIKLLRKKELEQDQMFMEYQFQLTVNGSSRTLTFLHFKGMLDGDTEDLPIPRMKGLITKIRSLNSNRRLIHCHAGVSRTGLVYTLLNIVAYLDDQKLPLKSLNVPDIILRLNHSRYAMVNMKNTQRLEFIHAFIRDWVHAQ